MFDRGVRVAVAGVQRCQQDGGVPVLRGQLDGLAVLLDRGGNLADAEEFLGAA
jgi:hypothetical protein